MAARSRTNPQCLQMSLRPENKQKDHGIPSLAQQTRHGVTCAEENLMIIFVARYSAMNSEEKNTHAHAHKFQVLFSS
jgi:hypothetical protein